VAWPATRAFQSGEKKMNVSRSFSFFRCDALCPSTGAFTLMEVMIASGIFFLATFTVLTLVSTSLRNARALQRGDVDASMAASQVYQLLKTNRQAEVSGSGDFGEAYPDYSFEFASSQYQSNGLLQVEIVVKRRGNRKPVDTATVWVYAPEANSSLGQPNLR
jgi:Tfp pilus assembly protein PilV